MPVITLNASNIASYDTLMDASMGSCKKQISDYIAAGATITVPTKTISYIAPGQSKSEWSGAVYMVENAGQGFAGAIITPAHGGGYALTEKEPESEFYEEEAAVPSEQEPASGSSAPVNSTSAANGENPLSTVPSGDPVNMLTGNMYHAERDLSIKGRGLPIVFERYYNSRNPQDGPLGFGWTPSFNHFLTFYGVEGGVAKVSWTDGTGAEKFFIAVPGTGNGVSVGTVFSNSAGVFVTFQRLAGGTYTVREKNGLTYTFESVAGTTGQKARLLAIADRNGNALNLTYTTGKVTVTDGLSRALTLTSSGTRIGEVSDWTGRKHQYAYDGSGNLISYKSPLAVAGKQNAVVYEYYGPSDGVNLNHALKRYNLPRGNGLTYEYYNNGKVFRHYNTLGETNTFTYNDFRRETVQVNERGKTRSFFFDKYGNPTLTVEENGAKRSYGYDASDPKKVNNRTSKMDPEGYLTQYANDAAGNVTLITNPSGSTVAYSFFDAFNQPGKVKDTNDNYTLNKYDVKGNLLQEIRLKSGLGGSIDPTTYSPSAADVVGWTVNTYDSYGNVLTTKRVRDFNLQIANPASLSGPSVVFDYSDGINNVAGLNATTITRKGDKNGDGVIDATEYDSASLAYDALGRVTTGLNRDWQVTQLSYDDLDRVVRGTDAFGNLRDYTYDANGNKAGQKLEISRNGSSALVDSASIAYDLSDRKQTTTDAGGGVTSYRYDAAGNVVKITNPDNYTLSFDYDDASHVVKAWDEQNHAVQKTVDLSGKTRTITDPNGNTTTYQYYDGSGDGRLKSLTKPVNTQMFSAGYAKQYAYDGNGNVVTVIEIPADAAGDTTKWRTTLTTYDELNRPIRVAGPQYTDNTVVSPTTIRPVTVYRYDTLGNRIEVLAGKTDASGTNPAGDLVATQASYQYDDFGRKIRDTDPLGEYRTYTYDVNNNVSTVTDAKQQVTGYTWGYGHQLLARTSTAGNATYTRNAIGQTTTVDITSPAMSYGYTYDSTHRLTNFSDSRGNKSISYSYSPGGLLNWMMDSDGNRTDYEYDPVGRLAGIWAPNMDYVTLRYDEGGRLTEKWFPNGVRSTYSYNQDNSISVLANKVSSGDIISQNAYGYDGVGNRLLNVEQVAGYTTNYVYSYDELNRLTVVSDLTDNTYMGYWYDALNNRVAETDGTDTEFFLYDAANQMKEVRQGSVDGDLLVSFGYDANGNLTTKTEPGETYTGLAAQSYGYDDQGRRVSKTVGASTTNYLYNGQNILAEYASWGSPSAQYTYGPGTDDPILRAGATKTQYFHKDGMGSVVAVSDSNGEGAAQWLDPWGIQWDSIGSIPTYGYTGREPDETGLIYYRARYYDPTFGRFTQRDPVGLTGGINQYAYVGGNPTNRTDPSGTIFEPISPNTATAQTGYAGQAQGGLTAGEQSLASAQGNSSLPDLEQVVEGESVAQPGRGTTAPSLVPSAGGVVRQFEQVSDQIYYRIFSGDATVGGWLTALRPRSSAWAQEALALPPGNEATMIQEVLVPSGTLLERSRAIPVPDWGRMRGGAEQFHLLDEIPPENFGQGRPLL